MITTLRFQGKASKEEFYLLLEYIDGLKQRGWKFIKHERNSEDVNIVEFDYELEKRISV
ncbi:MAG: hypothetical protein Q8O88_03930 [bacterium]|nr:hypothetical protein [bacterium]